MERCLAQFRQDDAHAGPKPAPLHGGRCFSFAYNDHDAYGYDDDFELPELVQCFGYLVHSQGEHGVGSHASAITRV